MSNSNLATVYGTANVDMSWTIPLNKNF